MLKRRKPKALRKDVSIVVRMTAVQHALLKTAAEKRALPLTTWLVSMAIQVAGEGS